MIYLVGSYQRAWAWCIEEGVDASDAQEVCVISDVEHAQGHRPRPSDRIVVLEDGSGDAALRLRHSQELTRTRRDISLRQAP